MQTTLMPFTADHSERLLFQSRILALRIARLEEVAIETEHAPALERLEAAIEVLEARLVRWAKALDRPCVRV
jgi:hypothetical protein